MELLTALEVNANVYLARRGLTPEDRSRAIGDPVLPTSVWSEPVFAALLLLKTGRQANEKSDSPSKIAARLDPLEPEAGVPAGNVSTASVPWYHSAHAIDSW